MNENENPQQETPEQRGERIGEQLAAMERQQAANPAAVAAQDKKKHTGLIVAVVLFAVLLVGAGVAYSALAPAAEQDRITQTPAAANDSREEAEDDASAAAPDASSGDSSNNGTDSTSSDAISNDGNTDNADGSANANDNAAPDFTMTNAEGKVLSLEDFKGKPVLLNFWASWCGPCASEMPDIQKAYEKYGDQIEFVIVNMTGMSGETEQSASAFIQENGYTFPVYFDQNNSAATAFAVYSIPQTYLIDPQGSIIGAAMGAMDEATIEEGIGLLQASE